MGSSWGRLRKELLLRDITGDLRDKDPTLVRVVSKPRERCQVLRSSRGEG